MMFGSEIHADMLQVDDVNDDSKRMMGKRPVK
jgi:hypothetical protein